MHAMPPAIVSPNAVAGQAGALSAAAQSIILEVREILPAYRASAEHDRKEAARLGEALYRLRQACPHGAWTREVQSLGIHIRTARRLVDAHAVRNGLKADSVSATVRNTGGVGTRAKTDTLSGLAIIPPAPVPGAFEPLPEEDGSFVPLAEDGPDDFEGWDEDDDGSRGTVGCGSPAVAFGHQDIGGGGVLPPAPVPGSAPAERSKGAAGEQLSLAGLFEAARAARAEFDAFLAREDVDAARKAAVVDAVRRVIGGAL